MRTVVVVVAAVVAADDAVVGLDVVDYVAVDGVEAVDVIAAVVDGRQLPQSGVGVVVADDGLAAGVGAVAVAGEHQLGRSIDVVPGVGLVT